MARSADYDSTFRILDGAAAIAAAEKRIRASRRSRTTNIRRRPAIICRSGAALERRWPFGSVAGKTILYTGAAGGLGLPTTLRLLAAGARVVAIDNDAAKVAALRSRGSEGRCGSA